MRRPTTRLCRVGSLFRNSRFANHGHKTPIDGFPKPDLPSLAYAAYTAIMTAQSELWKQLAERLGIVAVAPFQLEIEGERIEFAALLPQFGGAAGLVADPEWTVIEPHADALIKAGFGFSAVTLDETFDGECAREMLRDWGWSEDEARPVWV